MKKIFILLMALFATFLFSTNVKADTSTITEDGVYTFEEELDNGNTLTTTYIVDTTEEPINIVSRATKSTTKRVGTVVRLASNNTIVADAFCTATFKYDGTYVWGAGGTSNCIIYNSSYNWYVTKNTYSSAKVKTKSTYYSTIHLTKLNVLIKIVKNNAICTPSGKITVSH